MSKLDVTTRDLFMRLGSTSQLRSARADAVFRRLRIEKQDRIADALSRAAHRLEPSILGGGAENGPTNKKTLRDKAAKRPR